MKKNCNIVLLMTICVSVWGCGKQVPHIDLPSLPKLPELPNLNSVVVRSQAILKIQTAVGASSQNAPEDQTPVSRTQNSGTSISITNSASSSINVDQSLFGPPTSITNNLLDFGYLALSNLFDNDLKKCGSSGNQKCGTALIRMYTTGTAGSGLYNSQDGYGLPITAGQSLLTTVGLGISNAALMQIITIPTNRNTVKLSDFINPKYNVKIDFSDAGAATFSTTLVLEYALAP